MILPYHAACQGHFISFLSQYIYPDASRHGPNCTWNAKAKFQQIINEQTFLRKINLLSDSLLPLHVETITVNEVSLNNKVFPTARFPMQFDYVLSMNKLHITFSLSHKGLIKHFSLCVMKPQGYITIGDNHWIMCHEDSFLLKKYLQAILFISKYK